MKICKGCEYWYPTFDDWFCTYNDEKENRCYITGNKQLVFNELPKFRIEQCGVEKAIYYKKKLTFKDKIIKFFNRDK
jgi:hypothetical protein